MIDTGGRTVVFRALTGSYNYNLQTPESDKDYKAFVLPTFEDLYERNMYSNSVITSTEDNSVHDIRKLVDLFYKSNPNFLEILFSKDIKITNDDFRFDVLNIFNNKNDIVRMNLPHLYNSCMGMHLEKRKSLRSYTEGTKHLYDKFGYDSKQALHSYRNLDILIRFHKTGFFRYQEAIEYNKEERENMLAIKHGRYSLEQMYTILDNIKDEALELEKDFMMFEPNEKLKEKLYVIIKYMVKDSISSEFE